MLQTMQGNVIQAKVDNAGQAKPRADVLPGFEAPSPAPEIPVRQDPALEALLQKLQSIRPETVNGFSKGEFSGEVGKLLTPRLREFTGSQFASLMGTFMSWLCADPAAAEKSRSFYLSASTEMASRLMEFSPHEMNCCLASLISSSYSDLRFFAQVGRAALARHSSFGPVQLTALLSLLSEVRLVHLDLFNAAAQFI